MNNEQKKNDMFVYYGCVNGNCPLVLEEEMYGVRISTCEDYCGNDFSGCNLCYFNGSDYCKSCIHFVN